MDKAMTEVREYTAQEVFDIAAVHLIEQGKHSKTIDDGCAYRGDGGCMCAIGVFIPDRMYEQRMEGKVVGQLFSLYASELAPLFPNATLMRRLQRTHDGFDVANWDTQLRFVAKEFHLSTAALDDAITRRDSARATPEAV